MLFCQPLLTLRSCMENALKNPHSLVIDTCIVWGHPYNLPYKPIPLNNSSNQIGKVSTSMITLNISECQSSSPQLPLIWLIWWGINIVCCNGKIGIIRLWCPGIKGDWDLTRNILYYHQEQVRGQAWNYTWRAPRTSAFTSSALARISSLSFLRWGISDSVVCERWYLSSAQKDFLSTTEKAYIHLSNALIQDHVTYLVFRYHKFNDMVKETFLCPLWCRFNKAIQLWLSMT